MNESEKFTELQNSHLERSGLIFVACSENATFTKQALIFFLNLVYGHFRAHLPMSGGGDEVNAAVDSGVWNPLLPVDVDLLLQVRLVLVVNELHDGLPAKRDRWGGDDEEREQKEETRKSTEYLISQTFDVREGFTNIPVLIVDLVSKAWCVNDGQLHPHPLLFNVCTRHTIIKHTHTSQGVCHHLSHDNLTNEEANFVLFASLCYLLPYHG